MNAKPYAVVGPLRACSGPHDAEGLGMERFWDLTPEQRQAQLAQILRLTQPGNAEQDRLFAKGWLSEHERLRSSTHR